MSIDHSRIYTDGSLRNIGHRMRLNNIVSTVARLQLPVSPLYVDVGCSNGFITDRVAGSVGAARVIGLDHDAANLDVARRAYPRYAFEEVDLNCSAGIPDVRGDLVTCFETLEHVGNLSAAVEGVWSLVRPGGVLLVSVPIESTWIGLVKYLAKTKLFGYRLDELSSDAGVKKAYERALWTGGRLDRFRESRPGWATHFGFEFRLVQELLRNRDPALKAWTVGTSRFLLCRGAHR